MNAAKRIGGVSLLAMFLLFPGCGGGGGGSSTPLYTVGGTIIALNGSLTLQNNGDDHITLNTNGSYVFPTALPDGADYNISISTFPVNQTCTVANPSGTISSANITNVSVTCRTLDPIEIVSVDPDGIQGNSPSESASISANGRYVAFHSSATTLCTCDLNGVSDIFVFDSWDTGFSTERVSVSSTGAEATGDSYDPDLSGDGRYLAFTSVAGDLVAGDTNGFSDIFVRDLLNGVTARTSIGAAGEADNASNLARISTDGRFVVFESLAGNLVANDTNGMSDIFIHDRQSGVTERVSLASNGAQGNNHSYAPDLSDDGRYVVFESDADNLVAGDTPGYRDIFLHDRQTGQTLLVSRSSGGAQANNHSYAAGMTPDGRYVVFASEASNLVPADGDLIRDIYRYDRLAGTVTLVSVATSGTKGNADSDFPSISGDGRFIAFESVATNLVSDDSNGSRDIFVRDMLGEVTRRKNVTAAGAQAAAGGSLAAAISADGNYLAFESDASNLVVGDLNATRDVFVAPAK